MVVGYFLQSEEEEEDEAAGDNDSGEEYVQDGGLEVIGQALKSLSIPTVGNIIYSFRYRSNQVKSLLSITVLIATPKTINESYILTSNYCCVVSASFDVQGCCWPLGCQRVTIMALLCLLLLLVLEHTGLVHYPFPCLFLRRYSCVVKILFVLFAH